MRVNQVRILYFASLREVAGRVEEEVLSDATDLAGLYAEAAARHGFKWPLASLRVALNGSFARWDDRLPETGEVAFIPPVSGG